MTDIEERPTLDLYYWPTPNGWKISILLEELQQPYNLIPVDIRKGEQFSSSFLDLNPNNKIPALVDRAPVVGNTPVRLFESAAIMIYLAEKYGRFLPQETHARLAVIQWLAWQISALGPTAGQVHHFLEYAAEPVPYAVQRFTNEINRLYGVLDRRLTDRDHIVEEYSIADMACWVWVRLWRHHGQDMAEFPNLRRWLDILAARPAVNKGFRIGNELREGQSSMTEEARKFLLDQRSTGAQPAH